MQLADVGEVVVTPEAQTVFSDTGEESARVDAVHAVVLQVMNHEQSLLVLLHIQSTVVKTGEQHLCVSLFNTGQKPRRVKTHNGSVESLLASSLLLRAVLVDDRWGRIYFTIVLAYFVISLLTQELKLVLRAPTGLVGVAQKLFDKSRSGRLLCSRLS